MQVVIVEDCPQQAEHIRDSLEDAHHQVIHFTQPHQMFYALSRLRPGLFILDWCLPELDGGRVLQRTRALYGSSVPVMVLTSDSSDSTAIQALDLGADDFVNKPVSGAVLRARVGALLRRRGPARPCRQIDMAPYRLDPARQQLYRDDVPLALTRKEFDLAWVLFSAPHRFVSHAEIGAALWGIGVDANSHTVSQHMHSLRRKLELARHGFRLSSVYGAGYRLEPPVPDSMQRADSDERSELAGAAP